MSVIMLHVQNSFKSCPTWSMHELSAQRSVVCCCDLAEQAELILEEMLAMRVKADCHDLLHSEHPGLGCSTAHGSR